MHIQISGLISSNIAGFDLDHTLICPRNGKTHPKDKEDLELCFPNIKEKLLEFHEKGYSIVIFSNQSSFDKPEKKEIILTRIATFIEMMGIPISVLISTESNHCRKPNIGMWDYLQTINPYLDNTKSFYVGDAAGRTKNSKTKKKDFACSDRMFALNVGCKFYTPEKFFQPETFTTKEVFVLNKTFDTFISTQEPLDLEGYDVVMLVGPQGSGKSTISKSLEDDFTVVSQDQIKYKAKCLKLMESLVKNNEKVLIDNTNGKKYNRDQYLDIAKKYGKKVLCIVINISKEQCLFLVNYRCKVNKSKKIPDVVIHTYDKNYEVPIIEEGFDKIIERTFVPDFSRFREVLFNQYY